MAVALNNAKADAETLEGQIMAVTPPGEPACTRASAGTLAMCSEV